MELNKRQRIGLVLFLLMVNSNMLFTNNNFFIVGWILLMIIGAWMFIKNKKEVKK